MAASVQDVYATLVDSFESTVGLRVVKRFPGWARLELEPPQAALGIVNVDLTGRRRIGDAAMPDYQFTWQLAVFCRNEPELMATLAATLAWLKASPRLTTGAGDRFKLALSGGLRHESQTGTQTEAHAFIFTLITTNL